MLWFNQIADQLALDIPHLINDSKTPSGRVHVGALRGVIIHDVVLRVLKERGASVKYTFGVDDYDPLDELPAGHKEYYEPYLGMPLCNVPAPAGSNAPDIAEHYIREFFSVFRDLGVQAETYRMRDVYRAGKFNEVIDAILRNAHIVRQVYLKVNNAKRPDTWHPFQVVCEQCGRVGTTEVSAYDGQEVTYVCQPKLVKWAQGCGYKGKVSPFDGRGKLPWKLEWAAKWKAFSVTVEGAGKDHTTRGGSHDVAAECLRAIFGKTPPLNIPYEFFLVGGAKMSSSRGIGASARDMADFLPPEILRFLILRTPPNQPVNFALNEEYMVKLFNDFDRVHNRAYESGTRGDKDLYLLSEVLPEGDYYDADFQLIVSLIQMPHLDVQREIEKRKGSPLTAIELKHLERRIHAARYWLKNYASEDSRFEIQGSLPESARALSQVQRTFLHQMAVAMVAIVWDEDLLQTALFDCARTISLSNKEAFQAVYCVLLDREKGPRAGSLLAFLDKDFVIRRFKELPDQG